MPLSAKFDTTGWYSFILLYKLCLDTTCWDLIVVLSTWDWQHHVPRLFTHLQIFAWGKVNIPGCHLTVSTVLQLPVKSFTCWVCLSITIQKNHCDHLVWIIQVFVWTTACFFKKHPVSNPGLYSVWEHVFKFCFPLFSILFGNSDMNSEFLLLESTP